MVVVIFQIKVASTHRAEILELIRPIIGSRDFKRIPAAMDLASQPPELSINEVSSRDGVELVEKLRLTPQAL